MATMSKAASKSSPRGRAAVPTGANPPLEEAVLTWLASATGGAVAKNSELLVSLGKLDDLAMRAFRQSFHIFRRAYLLEPGKDLASIELPRLRRDMDEALQNIEMQRLVDAAETKSDKADAIQARMRAKAVDLVMNGTHWLTATELVAEMPTKPSNVHTMLARWLDQGRIFALEKNGVRIFPRYAFDAMVEPVPLLKEVLKVLAGRSPFQIASWFESPSNYLNGKRPREVLEVDGLAVVKAAQRLVEGAVHG